MTARSSSRSPARFFAVFSIFTLSAASMIAACGGSSDDTTPATSGSKKKGGSGGGTAGGNGANAGGNSLGEGGGGKDGGQGPGILVGGGGKSAGGGTAGGGTGAGANNSGGGTAGGGNGTGGGNANGGSGGTCAKDPNTPPPIITRVCRPATDNECDGMVPAAIAADFLPEGTKGNGFDDDCDGLVDEGCACDGLGEAKTCYLFPSSETTRSPSLITGTPDWTPVGFCATGAAKDTTTCTKVGAGEFASLVYDGKCGAGQPVGLPSQETCLAGDYDCDGVPKDPDHGCDCETKPAFQCPGVLYTRPFPDPNNVGQFATTINGMATTSGINVKDWFSDATIQASVTNVRWTVTGGPCDNTLPNPTFAVFPSPTANFATHLGSQNKTLPQFPDPGQPEPSIPAGLFNGWVLEATDTPAPPSVIYPAFSLSGDYFVTAIFDYTDAAKNKVVDQQCQVKVQSRAPGLRVELCWPEVGYIPGHANDGQGAGDNDVDLHVARLQGNASADGKHGWFLPPADGAGAPNLSWPNTDDCYYSPYAGCSNREDSFTTQVNTGSTPGWYANEVSAEPGGVGVCHGWGSRRAAGRQCTSPRLDRDNITCDPTIQDPNAADTDVPTPGYVGWQGTNTNVFCGPENINLDEQVLKDGDQFAIGVDCYQCAQGDNAAASPDGSTARPAHPRVNIYCNGELKQGVGYDPAKAATETQYPQLFTEGLTTGGSLWAVGVVKWTPNAADPCEIDTTEAGPNGWDNGDKTSTKGWHYQSNGSEFQCVMNGELDAGGESFNPTLPVDLQHPHWPFKSDGSYPLQKDDLCPNYAP